MTDYHIDKRKNWTYTECKPCAHARVATNLRKRLENPEFKAQYAAKQSERYHRLYKGRYNELHGQRERWRKYHLTDEQYQTMLEAQNNVCACCHGALIKTPHVDHDHTTDEVRGLLCSDCNTGIGLLGDDLEGVMNAVEYLRSSSKQPR